MQKNKYLMLYISISTSLCVLEGDSMERGGNLKGGDGGKREGNGE